MSENIKKLAQKIQEEYRKEGREVEVFVEEKRGKGESERNEVAERVGTILSRIREVREPFLKRKKERQKRRRELIDGFFDGVRRSRLHSDAEELERENERLREKLKEKESHPPRRRSIGHKAQGVVHTQDGKDIAIEL